MRLRYLAATGPEAALAQLSAVLAIPGAPDLKLVAEARDLSVWVVEGTPWIASADGAVVIGLLFDRTSGARCSSLPHPLPPAEKFMRDYWGSYVLVARNGGDHKFMRDPSGGVGAYHRRVGDLDLYASDAALLAAASPEPLRPDLTFLRQWLIYPYLRSAATGVVGVREITPGTVHRNTAAGEITVAAWRPWDHARPRQTVVDFEAASALLRDALLGSVPRLANDDEDIVLQLSGGLDSSIVAVALTAAGRRFRAVTFASRAPDGDERNYARLVARHCGIALDELVEDDVLPNFGNIPELSPRPPANALLEPLHRALANHLTSTGAELTLDGAGGDNVFCSLNSASPAVDALRRRGPVSCFRSMQDLARLHGTTLWAVARSARRRAIRRIERWRCDESFLMRGVAAGVRADHLWLDPPRDFDLGTYEQVQALVGIRHFLSDSVPGAMAMLHPLLAQPVVEACLRIPSWLWIARGCDRAVAREALADLLPDAIRTRRAKGGLVSLYVRGYMHGRAALKGLLLEGKLAEAGLIDRVAVHDYLHLEGQPSDAGYIRLLELSSAENWLRAFDA